MRVEFLMMMIGLATLVFCIVSCLLIYRVYRNSRRFDRLGISLLDVMDTLPYPVYCKDVDDDFRILYSNRIVSEYAKTEPQGKTDFDVYPKEFAEKIRQNDIIVAGKPFYEIVVFDESYQDQTGKMLYGKSIKQMILDSNGKRLLFGITIEHTDATTLRKELEERESLLHTIITNLPIALLVKEVEKDFRYMVWNRILEEQTGLLARDVLGKNNKEIAPWPGRSQDAHEHDLETLQKESVYFEKLVPTFGGREIFYKVFKKAIKVSQDKTLIIDMGIDVTRERELEQHQNEMITYQKDLIDKSQLANDCLRYIIEADSIENIVNYVLSRYGIADNADRLYFYQFRDQECRMADCRFEWCAHGIEHLKNIEPEIDMSIFRNAMEELRSFRQIVVDDTDELELDNPALQLKGQQICSLVVSPVKRAGHLFGFVGLEYLQSKRVFSESDLRAISNVSLLIELAYTKAGYSDGFASPDACHSGEMK